jgi:Magnesium chelatase, subunit ChlI C-terminal
VRASATSQGALLDEIVKLENAPLALIHDAADAMRLAARGYHRVLRVARTLANLDGSDNVARAHLAEALSYRVRDGRREDRVGSPAAAYLCLSASSRFRSFHAARYGIENSEFGLLDRRDGVIDGEFGFPLEPLGMAFRTAGVPIALFLSDAGFDGLQIVCNLRLKGSPISGSSLARGLQPVVRGLDVSVHFFDRCRGGSTRLIPSRHHFVMRLLLRRRHSVLGVLGVG